MKATLVNSEKGSISLMGELATPLRNGADLLQVLMDSPSDTVALKAADLDAQFFDLRTGVAGDMLQKVSNYKMRLIILGDFTAVTSQSLRDFIWESNKRGQVVFTDTLESAITKLN
ncbi:hypothetical protein D3C86_1406150 [compost metagenome]